MSRRLVGLVLCALVTASSPGCFLMGARVLGSGWAPVDVQPAVGISVPLATGTNLIVPVDVFASADSAGGCSGSVVEFSAGVAYMLPGSTDIWHGPGVMTYIGGGVSSVVSSFSDGATTATGASPGAYVHAGSWLVESGGMIGFEVRYTMAAGPDFPGRDLSANGLQLMLVLFIPEMLENLNF